MVCRDSTGQVKLNAEGDIIYGKVLPGASDRDWNWLKLVNTPGLNPGTVLPLKEFVVKGNEVHVLDLSREKGSELLPGGGFTWPKAGRCTWPKRSPYQPEM